MDTKTLERFATRARRELLASVAARATAVIATGSVARSEHARTVRRLEAEIADHGHKHVIDKVAYTWFNRLIALRYMDVRGYTGARVVSPAPDQAHGLPEILADAKRGYLDEEVVTSVRTREAIMGLLDGTRRSTNAEGEAYAMLLTEHCRFWNKAMPFMFEREGDYTELLIPSGLLADGTVLSHVREILTEQVCKDVEVIGWLYQFYISERKQEVFDSFSAKGTARKLAGPEEIPAATQLFTPHWIVRYLVENSVGRLWMLNHPTSRLVDQMDYYISPVDEVTDFLEIGDPEELTVIDPACGSGHMLTYAFDLLYAIYEEEGYAPSEIPSLILTHNLHGTEIDPRAGVLAAFALTMKARGKDRRFLSREVEPKICVIEPISFALDELDFLATKSGDQRADEPFWNQFRDADILGSLIQSDSIEAKKAKAILSTLDDDLLRGQTLERARQAVRQAEFLGRQYSVAVANPPYMGSKNMDARLAHLTKSRFPNSKSDLFAMFIERCLALTVQRGATAMITMQAWMFISSYEEFRRRIVRTSPPVSMVHLGERAFDSISGAVVSTTAFVLELGRDSSERSTFVRVVDGQNEVAKRTDFLAAADDVDCDWHFTASIEDFSKVPGSPIAYWLSGAMREVFSHGKTLASFANPHKGLDTGNNARFIRYWWEVSQSSTCARASSREVATSTTATWFPHNKGGEFRKWWGNQSHVLNWRNDGEALYAERPKSTIRSPQDYFRPCISWSRISSGDPAFRYYPSGFTSDDVGPFMALVPEAEEVPWISLLNSSSVQKILTAVAPTLHYEVGQVKSIPVLENSKHLANTRQLIEVSRTDWDDFETSWGFGAPSWIRTASNGPIREQLMKWSTQWAEIVSAQRRRETENNRIVAETYGLQDEVTIEVPLHRVSLNRNVEFRYGPGKSANGYKTRECADFAAELVSYAIGCMFGRYSLDGAGLVLADQGSTVADYLAQVPQPAFTPDADNVIPVVDDGWFGDDIVERFRQFLRTAFGAVHFEENLRFVEESLGVKSIRDYFIAKSAPSGRSIARSKFYDDHVQRYKRRPIYWMFSSPKGSFNALIYLHRYTPATVSTVLNEYLREYRAKLEVALQLAEEAAAGGASEKDQREAERLRAVLAELRDYENRVLYPLDIQMVEIDLDDGVKVNYPKFAPALRSVKGLEIPE